MPAHASAHAVEDAGETNQSSIDAANSIQTEYARRAQARQRYAARKRARATRERRAAGSRRTHSRGGIRGWVAEFATTYQRQLLVVGAVLVVFLLIGLLDMGVNWGKIYTGVHVGSIDVSGMTVEEAAAAIDGEYGARIAATEVQIYADETTMEKANRGETIESLEESETVSAEEAAKKRKVWNVTASELQARLYPDQLAEQALQVGRENGGLFGRISAQTFGWNIEPAIEMSDSAIETLGTSIDRSIGNAHVDYGIDLSEGTAVVTPGRAGREINRSTLRSEICTRLLGNAEGGFVATVEDADVRISEETARGVAERINAGIAHGATFTFEGTTWEASSHDLAALIDTEVRKDGESWTLDAQYNKTFAKSALLTNLNSTYSKQNVKVQFAKTDDTIMVQSDTTGEMPEVGKAVDALEAQTLSSTPSSTPVIQITGTQIPSSMSIEAAIDYGIITEISTYETEYTGGATNRNTNIHLAADLINNSIAKANGGTWSFNQVAGECNEEKGFKGAGVIVGNEVVDDVGGGICQVATTVFNAVYEAGLPIDDRSNHSLYIASYPAGRDAAISWPEPDLAWTNDTPSDILLQTSYTDTTITVTLLGVDPGYTVESTEGDFKDGEKHSVRTELDATLERGETQMKQAGIDGSSIEVFRTVKDANGNIVRKDSFTSVYDAQDEIILVGPDTEIDLSAYADDGEEDGSSSESSGESDESDAGNDLETNEYDNYVGDYTDEE